MDTSRDTRAGDKAEDTAAGAADIAATDVLEAASGIVAAQIEGSDARLAATLRSSPFVTTIVSADGFIEYQSPSSLELLGVEAAALLGVSFASLLRPSDEAAWADVLATAGAQPHSWVRAAWWMRSASGSYLPVESRVADLLGDPQVAGIVIHSRRDEASPDAEHRYDARWQAMAFLDQSTGLPNRGLFSDRLEQALSRAERSEQPVSVILVDLDAETLPTDSAGEARADDLARAAGRRVTETVRAGETVARFARGRLAILTESGGTTHSERLATRLLESLTRPIALGDSEATVAVCLGIATTSSAYESAGELLARAEMALAAARATGKPGYDIFHPDLLRAPISEPICVPDAGAVARGEMVLHYQPIFDLTRGHIVGVEALLRWAHPDHGLLSPVQFLAAAEATGELKSIGDWVIPTVCQEARALQTETGLDDLRISVNVSATELADPCTVEAVAAALSASGLAPEKLTVEVSESALGAESDATRQTLEGLRSLGVHISVDDFGTHPSSLITLESLAVDELKIDSSVVAAADKGDQAAAATLAGIVSLAGSLGMRTTAKGIETDGQLAQVRRAGCEFAQGYLLARPMEAARLGRLLGRANRISTPFAHQVAVLSEILESARVSSSAEVPG
jgi:diguanylate cyclase (GGDEF)-like protein/PAS domain S-box-containing protein